MLNALAVRIINGAFRERFDESEPGLQPGGHVFGGGIGNLIQFQFQVTFDFLVDTLIIERTKDPECVMMAMTQARMIFWEKPRVFFIVVLASRVHVSIWHLQKYRSKLAQVEMMGASSRAKHFTGCGDSPSCQIALSKERKIFRERFPRPPVPRVPGTWMATSAVHSWWGGRPPSADRRTLSG